MADLVFDDSKQQLMRNMTISDFEEINEETIELLKPYLELESSNSN